MKEIAPLFTGDIVNVSAWDDRDKEGKHYKDYFVKADSYSYTNYPGYRGFQGFQNEYLLDLTDELPSELEGKFDVVFNHTTLEHIFEIKEAFANLCALSKDIVIIIVPFAQVQHESDDWKDYWRFTPSCIRTMFKKNDFKVIFEAQSPHRHSAIYLLFVASQKPLRWEQEMPKYKPISKAGEWIGCTFYQQLEYVFSELPKKIGQVFKN